MVKDIAKKVIYPEVIDGDLMILGFCGWLTKILEVFPEEGEQEKLNAWRKSEVAFYEMVSYETKKYRGFFLRKIDNTIIPVNCPYFIDFVFVEFFSLVSSGINPMKILSVIRHPFGKRFKHEDSECLYLAIIMSELFGLGMDMGIIRGSNDIVPVNSTKYSRMLKFPQDVKNIPSFYGAPIFRGTIEGKEMMVTSAYLKGEIFALLVKSCTGEVRAIGQYKRDLDLEELKTLGTSKEDIDVLKNGIKILREGFKLLKEFRDRNVDSKRSQCGESCKRCVE